MTSSAPAANQRRTTSVACRWVTAAKGTIAVYGSPFRRAHNSSPSAPALSASTMTRVGRARSTRSATTAACWTTTTGSPFPLTQVVTKSGTERPAGEKKRMAWRDRTSLLS